MIKSASRSSITSNEKYRSMSVGNVPSSEFLIQTIEVGTTPLASITFDNLSQWAGIYRHLQVVGVSRVTAGTTLRFMRVRLNGDSAANYNSHMILGDSNAANPYPAAEVNGLSMFGYYQNGGSSPAGAFGAGVIDILDAYHTGKFKTIRTLGGQHSYSIINLSSGTWRSTSAVSSVTLFSENSDSFAEGSRFSIYGITA